MLRVFAKHKKEITYEKWIAFIGSSSKKEEFGEVGERKAAFYRARKARHVKRIHPATAKCR